MHRFSSISARLFLMAFAGAALLRTTAHSSSLDEHFKTTVNTVIQNVKQTQNPDDKRKILGSFLKRMDQGIGMAKISASPKDAAALNALQIKMQADELQLGENGISKVSNAELNSFAAYVQQDVEQAAGGIFISAGCLIVLLILLILFVR